MKTFEKATYAKIIFSLDDVNDEDSFAYYHYDSRPENRPIIVSDISEFKSWLVKLNPALKLFLVIHIGAEDHDKRQAEKGKLVKYPCETFIKALQDYNPQIKYVLASRDPNSVDKTCFPGKEVLDSDKVLDLNDSHETQLIQDLIPSEESTHVKLLRLNDNESVDFAIITALIKDEYTSFSNNMEGDSLKGVLFGKFKDAKANDYTSKKIALLHQKKMGMVDSSLTTSFVYKTINPKVLILAGVCGGRKGKKVKLYDIIIPENIVDIVTGKYEKSEFIPYGYSEPINEDLIAHLKKVTENPDFVAEEMYRLIPNGEKFQRENEIVKKIQIHYDVLACGPFVLKTEKFLEEKSKQLNDKIVGFEMESYGIMRATKLLENTSKISLVVKSVMDYTDSKKGDIKPDATAEPNEEDIDNIPSGENIKAMAAYMSSICTRALLPHIERFLIENNF
jgi:nucleoside phosphorylase